MDSVGRKKEQSHKVASTSLKEQMTDSGTETRGTKG